MNPHLNSALRDDPIERVGRLLTREGHAPQTVEKTVHGYREFVHLAVTGNMLEARDAATEGVMEAWDLARLDTIAYKRLMQSIGMTGQLVPRWKTGKNKKIQRSKSPATHNSRTRRRIDEL